MPLPVVPAIAHRLSASPDDVFGTVGSNECKPVLDATTPSGVIFWIRKLNEISYTDAKVTVKEQVDSPGAASFVAVSVPPIDMAAVASA